MAMGDVIRLTLNASDGLRYLDYTFHYAQDAAGSAVPDVNQFCQDWWTAWMADLQAGAALTTAFLTVSGQIIIGPNAGVVGITANPAGALGTFGNADIPREICIAITRKIVKAGRKYRGRLFWGPTCSGMFTNVAAGEVDVASAPLVALGNVVTSAVTSGGVGWDPVLVHASGKPVVYTRTPGIITESVVSAGACHRKSRRDKAYGV